MRNIRIYQPGFYNLGDQVNLSPEVAHHVGVVLRLKVGDKLCLFSGTASEWDATIDVVHKKQVQVTIGEEHRVSRESSTQIILAQCISKPDRMHFAIQKAVELGVFSIFPIISQHIAVKCDTIRLEKSRQAWQAVAIAASEQSGRTVVPEIHEPMTLEQYLTHTLSGHCLVLSTESGVRCQDLVFQSSIFNVLIGAEGGFSDSEMEKILKKGFLAWSLGARILRTETASIVALSILQAMTGGFE